MWKKEAGGKITMNPLNSDDASWPSKKRNLSYKKAGPIFVWIQPLCVPLSLFRSTSRSTFTDATRPFLEISHWKGGGEVTPRGNARVFYPYYCAPISPSLSLSLSRWPLNLVSIRDLPESIYFYSFHRIVSSSDTIDSLPLSFKEFVPFAILSPIQTRISNEGINAHVAGPRWKLDII